MATFPTYVGFGVAGYSEGHSDVVIRTEMERGVPKQRRTQSDVLVQVALTLFFSTAADAASFEDWYYDDAEAGAAWFDWTDPRTADVREARAVANTLGPLTTVARSFVHTTRTLTIEYLRTL